MKQALYFIFLVCVLAACNTVTGDKDVGENVLTHAQLLTMSKHDGITIATISNPWGEGTLHRYVLVPADRDLPDSLPEGTVVRTPLKNALVYSAVHTGVLAELGAADVVKGVTDVQYFTDSLVLAHVQEGTVADCGSSMSPTIEKVIEMHPDGILLSPYQDANYGQVTSLNIPLIECADYMEQTPLGRAEWIKFYGALVGKESEAEEIFDSVVKTYEQLRDERAASNKPHPKVLTETVISGVWNVPGGKSYMAQIIKDAGGNYPWADDEHSGSLSLDFTQVLAIAKDADVWLVKSFNINSYADLKGAYELNDRFDAFKNRKVYCCDTNATRLFERFPFHPELLLTEYCNIFDGNNDSLIFYAPCK